MKKLQMVLLSLREVTAGTWLRLALLIAALAAVGLRLFGAEAAGEADWAEKVLSYLLLLLGAAAGYWKNNSFTEAAQAADDILLLLKEQDRAARQRKREK